MKTRTGFVSNSSSSSFIINLDDISGKQLKKIISHKIKCKDYGMDCHEEEEWKIEVTSECIMGKTPMDNFDMRYFLDKIGVDNDDIQWERWG
jgi:hypothetical protein